MLGSKKIHSDLLWLGASAIKSRLSASSRVKCIKGSNVSILIVTLYTSCLSLNEDELMLYLVEHIYGVVRDLKKEALLHERV